MEKIRYWITAIGGDIGSAIARCIRAEYENSYIIGTDIREYVQGIDIVNKMIVVQRADSELYLEEAITICETEAIQCIIPAHEAEINFFARNYKYFEEKGIHVLVHSSEFLDICQSKYKTAQWLKSIDISVPSTQFYNEKVMNYKYPVIAKPDKGCGSHGIVIANNELDLIRNELEETYVIQTYIGSEEEEYTLAIFHTPQETTYVCMKRELGFGGMSVLVKTVSFPWLEKMVVTICKENLFYGCINVQFRISDGEYYIFEINPRISSTVRFRYLMGFKDVIWWIQYKFNKTVNSKFVPDGLIGVKTTGELIIS